MQTGNFVNPQTNYFAAPAQVDGSGQLIGHSHAVIEEINGLGATTPSDPRQFAFFKGLNAAARQSTPSSNFDQIVCFSELCLIAFFRRGWRLDGGWSVSNLLLATEILLKLVIHFCLLSSTVTGGLPAGTYKLCSINTAAVSPSSGGRQVVQTDLELLQLLAEPPTCPCGRRSARISRWSVVSFVGDCRVHC